MTAVAGSSWCCPFSTGLAGSEPGGEERPLASVVGQRERAPVVGGGLGQPPEPPQEVGARRRQQVIVAQGRGVDGVQGFEAGGRSASQADGSGAVELDDGRGGLG